MREIVASCLIGSLLVVSAARAQPIAIDPATRASARLLADDALALYDKGDCRDAAPKFLRAHDMVRVPTLAFYAGKCLEKIGRLVDASEAYLAATRDEIEPGAPTTVKQAQTDAATARAALLPRIPTIEVVLDASATGATVALDGKRLPDAAIGVKRPIDPGHHVAKFTRGAAVGSREFAVEEGDAGQVRLAFPATAATSAAVPAISSGVGPGPWIVGGVGVAGLLVGSVMGALVLVQHGKTPSGCMNGSATCTDATEAASANATSNTWNAIGHATTAALVLGGAGVIAGGIWIGIGRSGASAGIGPTAGGIAWRLEGSW